MRKHSEEDHRFGCLDWDARYPNTKPVATIQETAAHQGNRIQILCAESISSI